MAITHGLAATYRHGCRCTECRAAHTAKLAAERDARSVRTDVPHGLSGYNNWRCRCEVCRAAKSVANARCREQRLARATTPTPEKP